MSLGNIKASTQDASSGTPVAIAVNEDNGSVALQAMAPVGNKTTYSAGDRTGLTGADAPTGGDLTTSGFAGSAGANLFALGNALSVVVRATCSLASKTLTGFLVFYDGSNAAIGFSETLTFVSHATLRLGNGSGDFVSQRLVVDAGDAVKAEFFVSSVTAGTWAVHCRPV